MSERHITTGNYFLTGITLSALIHMGIFYLVYFVFGNMEKEIEYVCIYETNKRIEIL